jgi:hypothetical protein
VHVADDIDQAAPLVLDLHRNIDAGETPEAFDKAVGGGQSNGQVTSVRLKVKQWQLFREGAFVNPDFLLRKGAP